MRSAFTQECVSAVAVNIFFFYFFLFFFFFSSGSNGEPIPAAPITVLNESMLSTWYDSTQVCMIRSQSSVPVNASYWNVLHGCEDYLSRLPVNNGSKPWHRHPGGFGVLPSSAYTRKARDGCCNSDVNVPNRGFDWVWEGYENGSEQRQCIELMTELSKRNKSIIFMGDSMNNQVFMALIEECNREGIQGGFDGGAKGSMPWVIHPEAYGMSAKTLGYLGAVSRFDWAMHLRSQQPSSSSSNSNSSSSNAYYNNSVYIYAIDIWYGRRNVYNERLVMEVMIPLICRSHVDGVVVLPNIGHHLEAERDHSNFNLMIQTVSGFLNWMNELAKINWGRNIVVFRETTPSHFDSPDLDGSYEKWKAAGRSNYDYMAKNPWDAPEQNSLYHCRSINTTTPNAKNTLENLVVADILKTWGKKKTTLQILPVFQYLAPFYRLKYGFCGGYDRMPVLDCVHFCAWGPTMWIPIWDKLLEIVRTWEATHADVDQGGRNYEPVFTRLIVEEAVILRRCDEPALCSSSEELFLYYHGVRHQAVSIRVIEKELNLLRNSSAFPPFKNVTSDQLSKILLGRPVEQYADLTDNLAIQQEGDLQIYWYKNGTRHAIPNWDTFCSLGFNRRTVTPVSGNLFERIKEGPPVPPHDWPTGC